MVWVIIYFISGLLTAAILEVMGELDDRSYVLIVLAILIWPLVDLLLILTGVDWVIGFLSSKIFNRRF
jgi:hypothetical protein